MRAKARESPGQPLGWPPSQGPPWRVVPDEAAMRWSRTSPAPRLRHPLGVVVKEEEEMGGWKGQEGSADVEDLEDVEEVVRRYSSSEHHSAPAVLQNVIPLRVPQQPAS